MSVVGSLVCFQRSAGRPASGCGSRQAARGEGGWGRWQVVESAKDNPLQVKGATSPQQTAVIAFTGRYYSGRPFQVLSPC